MYFVMCMSKQSFVIGPPQCTCAVCSALPFNDGRVLEQSKRVRTQCLDLGKPRDVRPVRAGLFSTRGESTCTGNKARRCLAIDKRKCQSCMGKQCVRIWEREYVHGKPAQIETACRAFRELLPPAVSSPVATAPSVNAQKNFWKSGGLGSPFALIMSSTYDPLSLEVTK